MKKTITIASIQMYIHQDKNKNIKRLKTHLIYLNKVLPQVKMVILPELSISDIHREPQKQSQKVPGQLTSLFSSLAKKHGVWLIPGSIYEKSGTTHITQLSSFLQRRTCWKVPQKIPLVSL